MREKGRAAIYAMAGIYLLIMDYNLWSKLSSGGSEYWLMLVFAVLFVPVGAGLIGFSGFLMHSLYKRDKQKGQE